MELLITGAGGSIGKALVVEALFQGHRITALDQSEGSLFWLRQKHKRQINYLLQDVQTITLDQIRDYHVVIHAAAYKHVASCEQNPEAAIKNNIVPAISIAGLCWFAGNHFVQISTDKVVEAEGVMGKTKWVAERGIDAWRHIGLKTTTIRFANVLGSSGSVLEVWDRREGEVIQVTRGHKRWFISQAEAAKGIFAAIENTDERNYIFAIKPKRETDMEQFAAEYARKNRCKIEYRLPAPGEKMSEKFCHENQELEHIEGLLYAIRRTDVEDSLLAPGKSIRPGISLAQYELSF